MKVSENLKKEFCVIDLKANNKDEAIREIVESLAKSNQVKDKEDFIRHIFEREALGSTGIGQGIAIPHSPTESVEGFVIGFGRSQKGIDFNSIDGNKVNLIFLMGTNPQELNQYLKLLAKLSKLLNDANFRSELLQAANPDEIIEIFKKYEKN